MARVLICDDCEDVRALLRDVLRGDGHETREASDGVAALAALDGELCDLLLLDLRMPKLDGLSVLQQVRAGRAELPVLVLTAHGTIAAAVQAMKLGAVDFLEKPLPAPATLRALVRRALRRPPEGEGLVPPLSYGDPATLAVLETLRKIAPTTAPVLLLGESGTGKEVAARTLHAFSPRAPGPFLAVNCAALSDTLLESELFGHERGAFTGAHSRQLGRLERASGGTLLLDEIGELRLDLQARLLRVLQERRFERVGGAQTLQADVRFVAATNRDLRQAVKEGSFRQDLYHRLAVFPLRLPPLRERPQDLVPLSRWLVARLGADLGRPELRLCADAEERLRGYPYYGNVRELHNILQRAAVLLSGDELRGADLWFDAQAGPEVGCVDSLAEVELTTTMRVLDECGGNRKRAAARLGIGLRTLYDRLKRYGVSR